MTWLYLFFRTMERQLSNLFKNPEQSPDKESQHSDLLVLCFPWRITLSFLWLSVCITEYSICDSWDYSGVQFASGSEIKFLNRALWLGVFSFPVTSLLSQLHTSQDINSRYPAKDQMRSKGLHSLAAKKMLGGRDRKLPTSVIVEKRNTTQLNMKIQANIYTS